VDGNRHSECSRDRGELFEGCVYRGLEKGQDRWCIVQAARLYTRTVLVYCICLQAQVNYTTRGHCQIGSAVCRMFRAVVIDPSLFSPDQRPWGGWLDPMPSLTAVGERWSMSRACGCRLQLIHYSYCKATGAPRKVWLTAQACGQVTVQVQLVRYRVVKHQ
jgi:hypothetical protein